MKESVKEKIQAFIGVVILIIIGLLMVIYPDLGGYEPHGRHYLMQKLLVFVWGMPVGIILLIFGALAFFGLFMSGDESSEEEKQA